VTKYPPFGGRTVERFQPFLRGGMSIRFLAAGLAAFATAVLMAALPVLHG